MIVERATKAPDPRDLVSQWREEAALDRNDGYILRYFADKLEAFLDGSTRSSQAPGDLTIAEIHKTARDLDGIVYDPPDQAKVSRFADLERSRHPARSSKLGVRR